MSPTNGLNVFWAWQTLNAWIERKRFGKRFEQTNVCKMGTSNRYIQILSGLMTILAIYLCGFYSQDCLTFNF